MISSLAKGPNVPGEANTEPEAFEHIPVDIACPNLIPGHRLRVTQVVYDPIGVLRMRYVVTPPLPKRDAPAYPSPFYCWWEATDDRDTHYVVGGGAFGPSPDGQQTEGVFSLTPLPPPEARELRVILHMDMDTQRGECAFTVDLANTTFVSG